MVQFSCTLQPSSITIAPQSPRIAAPIGKSFDNAYLEDLHIECPQCNSKNTVLVSQFGSTACKALFKCTDCKEPFDYFKCH